MKNYFIVLIVSMQSLCASENKAPLQGQHEKAICWGEDKQTSRIITVKNKTCFPVKVRMKNFGNQSYRMEVGPNEWEREWKDWEHNTKWRIINPSKLYSFYIPMQYILPKNKKISPCVEYQYEESYLQVRAVGEVEKAAFKNKRVCLKRVALDQAKYQVKIKNNKLAVMQIKQPVAT